MLTIGWITCQGRLSSEYEHRYFIKSHILNENSF